MRFFGKQAKSDTAEEPLPSYVASMNTLSMQNTADSSTQHTSPGRTVASSTLRTGVPTDNAGPSGTRLGAESDFVEKPAVESWRVTAKEMQAIVANRRPLDEATVAPALHCLKKLLVMLINDRLRLNFKRGSMDYVSLIDRGRLADVSNAGDDFVWDLPASRFVEMVEPLERSLSDHFKEMGFSEIWMSVCSSSGYLSQDHKLDKKGVAKYIMDTLSVTYKLSF